MDCELVVALDGGWRAGLANGPAPDELSPAPFMRRDAELADLGRSRRPGGG